MQVPGDVLLVFDCTAQPGVPAEMRVEAGLAPSSTSAKQLLGVCVPWEGSSSCREGGDRADMTQALCRTLEQTWDGDVPVLSVQWLCSLMKWGLRGTALASRVFVSQLGGGQLLDIHLPRLAVAAWTRTNRQSLKLYSGDARE
ncbi:hypothetical protein N657DRAFT_260030 [Parathielavia appendiculata]|uniref:Uncharacterized protein n=1 Tax=Parathielavia appendiculata TaxID=2587402 RepID=A0AAN6TRL4_9PEZI|nr:hypothetical protein N657DRAFT_260030 [Parathielavia appendiculata]